MDLEPSRSSEDVISLAEHAKLIPSDLLPVTQSIYFGPNYGEDVKLLEIDPELLATIEQGDRLILRGDKDDNSVICSENKTFEMRIAETSNSLLIIPDLKLPGEITVSDSQSVDYIHVTGLQQKYYELKVCKPKLHRLKVLLEENPYCGTGLDDSEKSIYSLDDILDRVQGSEAEIMAELKNLKAYKINGHWRLLEFDFHFRVLSHILNLIQSNSWSLDRVLKKDTIETLSELELPEVVAQCFEYFFEKTEADDNLYSIIEVKVTCFYAEMLLRSSGKFNLEEFLAMWQQCMPEEITTSLNQLEGVAIVEDGTPASIKYFPSAALPENPIDRFSVLFKERPKWTMNEIRPYLRELVNDNSGVSNLLAKYARASTQDGIKYYSSKHSR